MSDRPWMIEGAYGAPHHARYMFGDLDGKQAGFKAGGAPIADPGDGEPLDDADEPAGELRYVGYADYPIAYADYPIAYETAVCEAMLNAGAKIVLLLTAGLLVSIALANL